MQTRADNLSQGMGRLCAQPQLDRELESTADEQLMLNYAAGDCRAFESLYARHNQALYRFCLRHLTNASLAQDCFQEIWLKIINFRHKYRPTASFKTFLYRVAQNAIVDAYRKASNQRLEDNIEQAGEGKIDTTSFAATESSDERMSMLRSAISQLPLDQKTALLLKIDAGLSLQEIGLVMDCGRETVKSKLRYANDKLRRLLEDKHE